MSKHILEYECPACGGPLRFDANTQKIVCEYCNSEYADDFFDKKKDASDAINESAIDWNLEGYIKDGEQVNIEVSYSCTSCAAEIIADNNTAATECMYCGSPLLLTNNITGMLKPDLIIPFKIDKVEAERRLKQFYRKKILLPSAFKDKNRISKITGIYVPFWLFSAEGSGDVSYTAQSVSSHRKGDYKYNTIKHYSVLRSGSTAFIKVPVDASVKMDDNYMDGLEPYNYDELKSFSNSYMAGYFADKFDVDVNTSALKAEARIANSVAEVFKTTVKGYSSVKVDSTAIKMTNRKVHYALLPVWILNTNYNDKMYKFAINGQTGQVAADLPIDKRKKNILFASIFSILSAVFCLILYNIFI